MTRREYGNGRGGIGQMTVVFPSFISSIFYIQFHLALSLWKRRTRGRVPPRTQVHRPKHQSSRAQDAGSDADARSSRTGDQGQGRRLVLVVGKGEKNQGGFIEQYGCYRGCGIDGFEWLLLNHISTKSACRSMPVR